MKGYGIALLLIALAGVACAQQLSESCHPYCAGTMPFCRSYGRTLLTCDEALDLRERGYPWNSIYAASMIAARTGEDVRDLLRYAYVGGRTWPQLAMERGLEWGPIRDNAYDFGPECIPRERSR